MFLVEIMSFFVNFVKMRPNGNRVVAGCRSCPALPRKDIKAHNEVV